ncbi:hypothetical protein BC941DRAFT_444466 [Chlamydoabsidia padenii]|nr:hypothetical protein BC941DRAFT_444466 [Chlamydoabsidia padenii]
MLRRVPFVKPGHTIEDYHSLLKASHSERQEAETKDNMRSTRSFGNIEDIPYEYMEEQQTPQQQHSDHRDNMAAESWSHRRFSSRSPENQRSQSERGQISNTWGVNSVSDFQGFGSWATSKLNTKTLPANSWVVENSSQTSNHPSTAEDTNQTSSSRVKRVKPEQFADLQMEAMNHWTKGIDLDLEKPDQKKGKKAGWLTMEEFATLSTAPKQQEQPISLIRTASRPSSPIRSPPSPLKTSSSITDKEKATLTKLTTNLAKGNHGVYLFLDTMHQCGFGEHSLSTLTNALPVILSSLPRESNRTFEIFMSTLLDVINHGNKPTPLRPIRLSDKQPIVNMLRDFGVNIMDAATQYIQSYIVTPGHFVLILDFLLSFVRECHYPTADIPIQLLHERYYQLRILFLPRSCQEIQHRLTQLGATDSISSSPSLSLRFTNQEQVPSLSSPQQSDDQYSTEITDQNSHPSLVEHNKDDHVTRYLQQQLSHYQQYLASIKDRGIKFATTSTVVESDGWVVLRHARIYSPMILSPVIPDTATVYYCGDDDDDILSDDHMNAALIGCVAMVIPANSSKKDNVIIGTTIQYAIQTSPHHRFVAIKHEDFFLKYGHDDTFTLIFTPIKATDLLPLMDWLQYACDSEMKTTDFPPTLISHLLSLEEENSVPDYFEKQSLDVSTVLAPHYRGCKAMISENSWPQLQTKHLRLPPDRRPLVYSISDSQVTCLQYALSHSFSIITGGPGTGKTFLAGKMLELTYQALKQRYIHQPILVMASTSCALATLLSAVAHPPLVRDVVFFGDDDNDNNNSSLSRSLSTRDGLQLSMSSKGSTAWKNHRQESRELEWVHMKLEILQEHRQHVVVNRDPSYVMELMPPSYRDALQQQRQQQDSISHKELGQLWIQQQGSSISGAAIPTYSQLLDKIANEPTTMQPIIKRKQFLQQQEWMDTHRPTLISLSEGRQWPFHIDNNTLYDHHHSYLKNAGDQARLALLEIWSLLDVDDLWKIPIEMRQQLYAQVLETYDNHLNNMTKYFLRQQNQLLASLDKLRVAQWQSTCTFNRVVGMTTGFAMTNQSFVRALSPHVVIVDEAQTVSGGFLASMIGTATEHLILVGDDGVSDQYRCKGATLTDQWRMDRDVLRMYSAALGTTVATQIPAMKEKKKHKDININKMIPGMKHTTYLVTMNTLDGPGFVSHLALYLHQQESNKVVTILTNNHLDQRLVRKSMAQLTTTMMTPFSVGFESSVSVECVDMFKGKECDVLVLFVNSAFSFHQVALALSRAKQGLYIVGDRHRLDGPWQRLAEFMKHEGLSCDTIPLQCQKHSDTETLVGHPNDFVKVKNGGCSAHCKTLMSCGHVCQENCHHRSHSLVKCQQPCERPRPTNCTHPCKNKCYECADNGCPPCAELSNLLLSCDHQVAVSCYQQQQKDLSKILCQETTIVTLPCGHNITTQCHKVTSGNYVKIKCNELIEHTLGCGHIFKSLCGGSPTCTEQCNQTLECGHPCQQMCYVDHDHDRKRCSFGCPKQLICGHQCAKGCANPDNHTERCLKSCERLCSHGYKCDRICWEACIKCLSPCPNQCPHSKCSKKCYEMCEREPCDEPCTKILSCSHPCKSTCGESCATCPICHPKTQCSITLRFIFEFSQDEKIYTLPDCGCSFSLEGLDMYFASRSMNGEHMAIKQRVCPTCQEPIYTAARYSKFIKTEFNLIDAVKEQQEHDLQQLTDEERYGLCAKTNIHTLLVIVEVLLKYPNVHNVVKL